MCAASIPWAPCPTLRPYFSRLPRVAAPLHADVQALLPAHYKYIPKHVQTENKNKNPNIPGTKGCTKLNLCKLNDCVSLYETAETRGRLSAAAGIHQQRNLRICAPSHWSDGATGPPALLSSVATAGVPAALQGWLARGGVRSAELHSSCQEPQARLVSGWLLATGGAVHAEAAGASGRRIQHGGPHPQPRPGALALLLVPPAYIDTRPRLDLNMHPKAALVDRRTLHPGSTSSSTATMNVLVDVRQLRGVSGVSVSLGRRRTACRRWGCAGSVLCCQGGPQRLLPLACHGGLRQVDPPPPLLPPALAFPTSSPPAPQMPEGVLGFRVAAGPGGSVATAVASLGCSGKRNTKL